MGGRVGKRAPGERVPEKRLLLLTSLKFAAGRALAITALNSGQMRHLNSVSAVRRPVTHPFRDQFSQ